jgi:uridylate kinase
VYKRVLLKLSGEALASLDPPPNKCHGLHQGMLEKVASDIKAVYKTGVQISLVVGGGNIYRGLQGMNGGLDRSTSDHMGMLATVINGLAVQNAIEQTGVPCRLMSSIPMPTLCESYSRRRAVHHLDNNRVVVFAGGTGNPYFTTDTAAALRASEMDCDLLLKATKVPGVFCSDPAKNAQAQIFKTLTYKEVLEKKLKIMDATAIALIQDSHIPIAVFSIYNTNGFAQVLNGQGQFTLITS